MSLLDEPASRLRRAVPLFDVPAPSMGAIVGGSFAIAVAGLDDHALLISVLTVIGAAVGLAAAMALTGTMRQRFLDEERTADLRSADAEEHDQR